MLPINKVLPWPQWKLDSGPVIPKFYWDVYSQEQRIKKLCEELHKLIHYADYLGMNINLDHELIAELQDNFEKFKESGFLDYYAAQLEQWINDNIDWIFEKYCKMVFFGLTADGHFVAYIPSSWDEIIFDTGAVYGRFDYGRLKLFYDVDGARDIVREPEGELDPEEFERQINALTIMVNEVQEAANRHERTLYTPMSEGGDI